MERTTNTDALSRAVDKAFTTVILSPNIAPYRELEPYKKKIDKLIDKVVKKHKIPVYHRLPLTQFAISDTVFKLTKIVGYLYYKYHFNYYDNKRSCIYLIKNGAKWDLIMEHLIRRSGSDCHYERQSLQNKIDPLSTYSHDSPFDIKIDIVPDIKRLNPEFIMMLYGDSYIEIGEVHGDEQSPLRIEEVRPLRLVEAKTIVKMFQRIETKELGITPDVEAFDNIFYFKELPTFTVMWKPWTTKATVNINNVKYPHKVHKDLVFYYTNSRLSVFILKDNWLCQVPYMNTSNTGNICMGMNTNISSGKLSVVLKLLEEWFFYTKFTHISNKTYNNAIHLDFIKGKYDNIEFVKFKKLDSFLEGVNDED